MSEQGSERASSLVCHFLQIANGFWGDYTYHNLTNVSNGRIYMKHPLGDRFYRSAHMSGEAEGSTVRLPTCVSAGSPETRRVDLLGRCSSSRGLKVFGMQLTLERTSTTVVWAMLKLSMILS